ncbi:hypothetical protein C8Q80DRAFT_1201004 [Daedaleopsis nitida]|nr:hypothetical protein C8Q80DRAFT_1201004 [Daedaleopsis nitida]
MEDYATTTIHMTPHQFKDYIPTPDDFDSVYTVERVRQVAEAFRRHLATVRSGVDSRWEEGEEDKTGSAVETSPMEETVLTTWAEVGRMFSLFPGHILQGCEVEPENDSDEVHLVVNAALLYASDCDSSMRNGPNWELQRLSIVFRPGGPTEDPFDKSDNDNHRTMMSRRRISRLLAARAGKIFAYQHRTKLFQIFVNGERFRVLRWDRSGVIVTDAVDYANDLAGTRLLLQFLYGFCKLSDAAQGLDHTAVRIRTGSCGWLCMEVLACSSGDVDHDERSVASDEFSANFAFPEETRDAPESPLFENGLLHHDPCAACNPSTDHYSTTLRHDPLPVWKYMRALFRESLDQNSVRYQLTVGGQHYLVGKPIFEASGMVSRATRGYIALEW